MKGQELRMAQQCHVLFSPLPLIWHKTTTAKTKGWYSKQRINPLRLHADISDFNKYPEYPLLALRRAMTSRDVKWVSYRLIAIISLNHDKSHFYFRFSSLHEHFRSLCSDMGTFTQPPTLSKKLPRILAKVQCVLGGQSTCLDFSHGLNYPLMD